MMGWVNGVRLIRVFSDIWIVFNLTGTLKAYKLIRLIKIKFICSIVTSESRHMIVQNMKLIHL